MSPSSSPELATPWFMQYHVAGGPNNQGQEGYILSNANWDPISVTNDIEALTIANANLAAAIGQRIQRFSNTFFTVVAPADVVPAAELARGRADAERLQPRRPDGGDPDAGEPRAGAGQRHRAQRRGPGG